LAVPAVPPSRRRETRGWKLSSRLHGRDRRHLAAAHRDLRDAATERRFDHGLLNIAFPGRVGSRS